MEPDTLRELINAGPVEVMLNHGQAYTLQSSETTIISDFEISTLVEGERGLRAAYIPIDAISTVLPASESA